MGCQKSKFLFNAPFISKALSAEQYPSQLGFQNNL